MSKVIEYTAKSGGQFVGFSMEAAMDAAFTACGGKGQRPAGVGLVIRTQDHGQIVIFKPDAVGRGGNVKAPASELDAIIRQWADYKANGGADPIPESIAKQVARLMKPAAPPQMQAAAPPPPAMQAVGGVPRQLRQRRQKAG